MWILVELAAVFVAVTSGGILFGPKLTQYGPAKLIAGLLAISATLTFVFSIFSSSIELSDRPQEPMAKIEGEVETKDQSEAGDRTQSEPANLAQKPQLESEIAQEQVTQQKASEALQKEEVRQATCQGEIEAFIELFYMYSDQYKSLSQKMMLERFYVDGGNGNGFDYHEAEKQNCQNAASALGFAQKALERYDGCQPFSLQNEPFMGIVEREHAFYEELVTVCINKWN
jgi:hypothetical protein